MDIYQHYRKEEHAFIDKVVGWKDAVEQQYSPKLTDFLDPRETEIVRSVIGNGPDVLVECFGGSETSERKRVFIFPSYYQPEEADFQLSLFQLDYPSKYVSIEHRQVLGTLMSIGLKRTKYGDILFNDDIVQLVVAKEIADFIKMNLQSIGKATIALRERSLSQIITTTEEWGEQSVSVSSLRIDTVIAAIYNVSRQKGQALIQSGLVKVNWKVIENPSFECKERDLFSVRGYGRSKLISIEGKTKKEKWRIIVGKQK